MTSEPITAVICTRNRAASVGRAVESVLTCGPFELVIVDQSDDASTEAVVNAIGDARVRYIHSAIPGLSRAYNTAIVEAQTELIAFTDDDCAVPPDWLTKIEAVFDRDTHAALVYGQVVAGDIPLPPDASIPELKFNKPELFAKGTRFRVIGMGANFAARHDALLAVGGFDEAMGGGGIFRSSQDFDLQLRFWRAGFVILTEPSLTVDHFGVRTREDGPNTARAYGFGDGAFYLKHTRCRDTLAAWMLTRRIWHELMMPVACFILRRGYSRHYAAGFFRGLRASARHPIDRASRRYVLHG